MPRPYLTAAAPGILSMAGEDSLRAGFHDLCLGRDPPCGCAFCQTEEDLYSDNEAEEAERVLDLLGPSLAFGPPLRRGDLVRVGTREYRNDGIFLYDGQHLVGLASGETDYGETDYGRVPGAVSMTEFGTTRYYKSAVFSCAWDPVPMDFSDYKLARARPAPWPYQLYVYRHRTNRSDTWFVVSLGPPSAKDCYWAAADEAPGWLAGVEEEDCEKVPLHRLVFASVEARDDVEDA